MQSLAAHCSLCDNIYVLVPEHLPISADTNCLAEDVDVVGDGSVALNVTTLLELSNAADSLAIF